MKQNTLVAAFTLTLSLLLSACASKNDAQAQVESNQLNDGNEVYDPLEPINRISWDIQYDFLDPYFIKPVAIGYRDYMPNFLRSGLLNMANNLDEPSALINNLLQAKGTDAAVSGGRFLINSTLGLLGLIDVASHLGLEEKHEEFGEVLGTWGVSTGPYLMLVGPSDTRDTTGDLVDSAYFPLAALSWPANLLRWSVKSVEGRIRLLDQEQLLEDSSDPYIFVRESYFQRVRYEIYDGNVPQPKISEKEEDDFEAFLNDLE
ncbi:VacJ family lipoprotein [Gayadomonas joobiniege]|uniref:MlaA family lipoprotein n=1 Tax=Gayadomonas joobiniege TaxID=1234606 RepID=UPI0003630BBE|nr:VacJ family lipoprotein [Gayadomonas joobiniege]